MSSIRQKVVSFIDHFFGGHYVSEACHHAEHDECRRVCSFCGDECACRCHNTQLPILTSGRTYPKGQARRT